MIPEESNMTTSQLTLPFPSFLAKRGEASQSDLGGAFFFFSSSEEEAVSLPDPLFFFLRFFFFFFSPDLTHESVVPSFLE